MYDFCFIFLLFLFYSISGWLIECINCTIREKKLVYDRGFLLGPYCPIYGFGGVGTYLFLTKFHDDPIALFVLASVGASALEYFTSYLMEKLFKARWWDYSDKKYNVNGRICLSYAFLFGLLSMIFVYLINPFCIDILNKIDPDLLIIISLILLVLFTFDLILSFIIITKLKIKVNKIKEDSTSQIDKQIKEFLGNYNFFIKSLFRSFPKIEFIDNLNEEIRIKIAELIKTIEKQKKLKKIRKTK